MNAQETKEEEPAAVDSGEGDKSQVPEVVKLANTAAERVEKATAAQKVENDRAEAIEARRALGGTTEAGSRPDQPKETPREYAERQLRGGV